MNYIVYKTINLINGKKYIGSHSCKSLNDSYIGSGVELKEDIKKFGKESFSREIIAVCNDREEMRNLEKSLVNKEWINSEQTYNLALGGAGVYSGQKHPNFGKNLSDQTRKNISIAKTGKKLNPIHAEKVRKARLGNCLISEESRKKYQLSSSNRRWVNNGIINKAIPKDAKLPEGFTYGQLKRKVRFG
jgi:hypothetical protein